MALLPLLTGLAAAAKGTASAVKNTSAGQKAGNSIKNVVNQTTGGGYGGGTTAKPTVGGGSQYLDSYGDVDYSKLLSSAMGAGASAADVQKLLDQRTQKASDKGLYQYMYDNVYADATNYIKQANAAAQQQQQSQIEDYYADLLAKNESTYAAIQAQQEAAAKAAVEQSVNRLEGQKSDVEQQYQDLYRQLYLNRRMAEKNLPQQMAAMGYNGGLTESTTLGLQTSYNDALRQGEQSKTNTLSDIDQAIANARLTGDISIAEQAAALAQQGLASYSDIVAAMQQQQNWAQQFAYQQAQDERNYNYQVGRDQVSDNQWNLSWNRQQILDQLERSDVDYNRKLQLANLLYQNSGDASGYAALGLTANEISGLEASYAAAAAAAAEAQKSSVKTSGSVKGNPSMSLSTAKLYANNGIWDDAVLDVFHKNGYTDALLTAEYGYDPYASPFKDATGNARFKASGVQFSDAEYADFQYQVGMTRDDQGRLAMIQDAYKEKKITEAQANALLKQYGLSG